MTFDLSLFQPGDVGQSDVQAIATPTANGTSITGEEKLAQRFLVELLTEQGSSIYEPARGTLFLTDLRFGALNTWEIMSAFSAAALLIRTNLVAEESTTDPSNERYGGTKLDTVNIDGDQVSLRILVRNLAGTTNVVFLPLSFNLN